MNRQLQYDLDLDGRRIRLNCFHFLFSWKLELYTRNASIKKKHTLWRGVPGEVVELLRIAEYKFIIPTPAGTFWYNLYGPYPNPIL